LRLDSPEDKVPFSTFRGLGTPTMALCESQTSTYQKGYLDYLCYKRYEGGYPTQILRGRRCLISLINIVFEKAHTRCPLGQHFSLLQYSTAFPSIGSEYSFRNSAGSSLFLLLCQTEIKCISSVQSKRTRCCTSVSTSGEDKYSFEH